MFIAPDSGGTCTAGFMARSRSDGRLYLMTAGHCLGNTSTWRTRNAGGTLFYIGSKHSSAYPSPDAGLIAVSTGSHWWTSTGWGRVVVTASGSTSRDETYQIVDESIVSYGEVICMTSSLQFSGSTNFTRCGAVTDLWYDTTTGVPGVRVLDICGTYGGFSGGPYYKGHRAYGIHQGSGSGCRSYMMDAVRSEDGLNVNILHG